MARTVRHVIGGVDTHAATHHAAVIDTHGRLLADREFPTTAAGYLSLLQWLRRHGTLDAVGIEGTGSYGASLGRLLHAHRVPVLEVPRPDRRLRRQRGKSDPLDAEAAARAVLNGQATTAPKLATGPIESLRALRVTRCSTLKARTAAINALRALLVTAPEPLRAHLPSGSITALVKACLRLRPDLANLHDPTQATKLALRTLAQRVDALTAEACELHRQLAALTAAAAPQTSAVFALGPDTASALLITLGDNPDRLRSEASFARLCGVAPIPASSGKTTRHRLHRGGDRSANRALHIAVVVRLRYCPATRAYAVRRTSEGLSKPEIIRCLKRYLIREVFAALRADYTALST